MNPEGLSVGFVFTRGIVLPDSPRGKMVRTKSRDDEIDGVRLESRVHTCRETESFIISKENAEIPNIFSVTKASARLIFSKHHERPGSAMDIFHFPLIILYVEAFAVPAPDKKQSLISLSCVKKTDSERKE